MNLDGSGLRQLTDSGEYDDIDPIYLPDGHLMCTTTRCNSYVRCGPFINSYVLARCDAGGGNIYLISLDNEPDFVPSLMADGRVIYSRWEYTDKALWRAQKLWTVNQDGTGVSMFWGNQRIWPDHTSQPQQIPGSRRVMFCGVGHHDWWSGSIGIIDPSQGFNFPDGLTKVTRDLQWPETGNGPVDPGEKENYHASGGFTGYSAPLPLTEEDFLVSARGMDGRFRLYLMDVYGNRELIYEGIHNILNAIPVKARPIPPVQPNGVVWPGTGPDRKPNKPGVLFSTDVCQGVPDLPRGSVKYLRVFQPDYKTYSTWEKTYHNSGPPVSIVRKETVKRILGEVPVEADGSVNFNVPAGQAVYFQLLDEQHRCLQTMRSFTGVMPGEVRGCVGCHDSQSTPAPGTPVPAIAMKRPPSAITPPPWVTESIGNERFVQPVLNQYCGKCHQGDGKAREKLDLTLRPGVGPSNEPSPFKEPYLTLLGAAGCWGLPAKSGPGYGAACVIPVETLPNCAVNPVKTSTRTKNIEMANMAESERNIWKSVASGSLKRRGQCLDRLRTIGSYCFSPYCLAALLWTTSALTGAPIQHRFLVMDFWKGKVTHVDEKNPSNNTLLLAEFDGATEISTKQNESATIIRRFQLPRPRCAYMALKAADGTCWLAGGYAQGLIQYGKDGKLLREFQAKQPEGLVNLFHAGFQFLGNGIMVRPPPARRPACPANRFSAAFMLADPSKIGNQRSEIHLDLGAVKATARVKLNGQQVFHLTILPSAMLGVTLAAARQCSAFLSP
ncbi:MAG: hypothetical protein NTW21_41995 [Verrucomicrobia bacterium]|nr:hypothetical protein [Verrucomicrobiota bacterium]